MSQSFCSLRAPERPVEPFFSEKPVLYGFRPVRGCWGGYEALSLLNSIVAEVPRGLGQSPGKVKKAERSDFIYRHMDVPGGLGRSQEAKGRCTRLWLY